MRAIRVERFGGPEVMELREAALPAPGPGELHVRVRAAGVNPVDTYIRSGAYATLPPLPYTPGTDGAGEIEACGEGTAPWRPGDRVYLSGSIGGTYATHALCRCDQVHPLPDAMSFEAGAAIGVPYATALRALDLAGAAPGETVLVRGGTGGVGIAAVQLALRQGCRVVATGGSETGLRLLAEQGVAAVVDHTAPDVAGRIYRALEGRGPDVILEMLANANLAEDFQLAAPRGRIVVIGSRGPVQVNPRDAMRGELTLRGMMLWNLTAAERAEIYGRLDAALQRGELCPVIREVLSLEEAAAAHRRVMEPGAAGKWVLGTGGI